MFEEPEDIIKRVTGAERIEVSIIGVTLFYADGHRVVVDSNTVDALRALIYKAERKALDALRAEARRG